MLAALAMSLGLGIVTRYAGLLVPGWFLVVTGPALAFVTVLPALGGRMHEPQDSPFKKAPWRF